jgi:hypothetical protein
VLWVRSDDDRRRHARRGRHFYVRVRGRQLIRDRRYIFGSRRVHIHGKWGLDIDRDRRGDLERNGRRFLIWSRWDR